MCVSGGFFAEPCSHIYACIQHACIHAYVHACKGGGTGGAGGAIAPPLFTDHFKNYILFDYSDRKLLLTKTGLEQL